ncbi:MAG: hypothetical protein VB082_10925 [Christensenella sp.]|nr:hypothetical protein [Christensenella sp.]
MEKMEFTVLSITNLIGTITFFAGTAFLLIELFRRGVGLFSLLAYLCFLTSSILLSTSLLMLLVSAGGLSILFLLLFLYSRREKRRHRKKRYGEKR